MYPFLLFGTLLTPAESQFARSQMKLVQDGVVVALSKLIGVENIQAHRLVSGCLANLTTTRNVTWELLQANGHQVSVGTKSIRCWGNTVVCDKRCPEEGGG